VGAGLLVACVNLTNLLAVRWAGRRRELAIRTAMGAEIRALARLVVTESALLAAAGGLAGLVLAVWGVRLIVWLAGSSIPRIQEVTLDAAAFGWAAALTLVAGVLCALVPAWRAVGSRPVDALKAGAPTATDSRRWAAARTGLVAGEVALSGALLTVGALLLVSFGNVLRIDRGFEVDSVLAVDLTLPATRYQTAQARARFFDELLASLKMRPGVQAAGVVRKAPLEGEATVDALIPVGTDKVLADQPVASHLAVSPDYFQAMRMPLLRGRIFSEADRGRRVAVVTERTARTIWPGEDPVGRLFSRSRGDRTWEVVGVVRDARVHGLDREPGLVAYPAYWDGGTPGDMTLVVRTASDPTAWVRTVHDVVTALDPQLPLQRIRTMSGVLEMAVATRRFQLLLMLAFSGAGLLLAGLGVYGVISTIAARQEREFALRLALGATRAQVMALVVRRGLPPMLLGVCAGLALGAAASRTISGLLFGVDPLEPLIMSGVAAVLILVTTVACLAPAWRAARSSPSTMLRAI
jgi:predicted permease